MTSVDHHHTKVNVIDRRDGEPAGRDQCLSTPILYLSVYPQYTNTVPPVYPQYTNTVPSVY